MNSIYCHCPPRERIPNRARPDRCYRCALTIPPPEKDRRRKDYASR